MTVPSELPMNQKQSEDFIKADDDLEVALVLDVDEIVDIVRARHEDEEEEEDDDDEDEGPIPTVKGLQCFEFSQTGSAGTRFHRPWQSVDEVGKSFGQILAADLKQKIPYFVFSAEMIFLQLINLIFFDDLISLIFF